MPSDLRVSDIHFTFASAPERADGLLGYVSFSINDAMLIDGTTVRRSREGEIILSFPAKRGRGGRSHPVVRPTNATTGAAITKQVLDALTLDLSSLRPAKGPAAVQADSGR